MTGTMSQTAAKRRTVLVPAATHIGVLVAWELLSRFVIPPQFLPPPSAVAEAFVKTVRTGELPRQLWQTTNVLLAGFGLAIVSGMAVGIAMGTFQMLRRVLNPYVNAFYAMPTVAMVPLVIIWLGLGYEAKVFLTWLVAVFPVIINAQIGVLNVSPAFIETARAFGCNRWQIFRRVVLYAAVPFFIAGIRLPRGPAPGRGLVRAGVHGAVRPRPYGGVLRQYIPDRGIVRADCRACGAEHRHHPPHRPI